jgi:hypothetical protein
VNVPTSAIISSRRDAGGVAQALAQLAASPRHRRDLVQGADVEAEQRSDDEHETYRVHDEAPADADGADQDGSYRGADDAGYVDRRAVQRHRVPDKIAADNFLDERLPSRVIHGA